MNELRFYLDVFQKTQKRYIDLLQSSASSRFVPKNALRRNLHQQAEFLMQNVEKYSRQGDNAFVEKSLANLQNISLKVAEYPSSNTNAVTNNSIDIPYTIQFIYTLLELNTILSESLNVIVKDVNWLPSVTNENKKSITESILDLDQGLREHRKVLLKSKKGLSMPSVPTDKMLEIMSGIAELRGIPLKSIPLNQIEQRLLKLKSTKGGVRGGTKKKNNSKQFHTVYRRTVKKSSV